MNITYLPIKKNIIITDTDNFEEGITISTFKTFEEIKNYIFYIQAKVESDFFENIHIESRDVVRILEEVGLVQVEKILLDDHLKVSLSDIWNEKVDEFYEILCDDQYKQLDLEKHIYKMMENSYGHFHMIDVTIRKPKWMKYNATKPLTLTVIREGVLIDGIFAVHEKDRKLILELFPEVIMHEDKMFFSFENFPNNKYTFQWNGRHVIIRQNDEKCMCQVNIGHFPLNKDVEFPIKTYKEFVQIKNNMRLL